MAQLWRDFLIGESDIRDGEDVKLGIEAVAARELSYRKYLLDRSLLRKRMANTEVGSNRSANQTLYDMSTQEEDVHPKYVYFMLIEGLAAASWGPSESRGVTSIHQFARNCHFQALELLQDASLLDTLPIDQRGYTPIHHALYYADMRSTIQQEKTLHLLCQSKHSYLDHRCGDTGFTGLYLAYSQSSIRAMKVLLEHDASAISTLQLYSQSIPFLRLLYDVLYQFPKNNSNNKTVNPSLQFDEEKWQEMLQRLVNHPRLNVFLNPTSLPDTMIDYHQSHSWLTLQKWRYGKQFVVNGMILFRIREELRASKRNVWSTATVLQTQVDTTRKNEVLPTLSIDEYEQEQQQYLQDLERRTAGQQARKKHKGKLTKAQREHEQQINWDRRQRMQKDRLEGEYEVKLSGLIVG